MRTILALLLIALPLAAAKKPTPAQLQAQVKRLTDECDGLKLRLAATEDIQQELAAARKAATDARAEAARLRAQNESLQSRANAVPGEGDLVTLSEEMQPARPINLNRMVPRLKASSLFAGRPKGVVVVNVLISEKGDVLAARLLQGLPGDSPDVKDAGEACVEAAKHLVFDPAASKDGKTRFKVWQGVGFYLD